MSDIQGDETRLLQIVQEQNAPERSLMRDIVPGCCQFSIKPGEVQRNCETAEGMLLELAAGKCRLAALPDEQSILRAINPLEMSDFRKVIPCFEDRVPAVCNPYDADICGGGDICL